MDYAIGEFIYMLLSAMNLRIGNIRNYNNKILISSPSFKIGTNLKISLNGEKDKPDVKSNEEHKPITDSNRKHKSNIEFDKEHKQDVKPNIKSNEEHKPITDSNRKYKSNIEFDKEHKQDVKMIRSNRT